MRFDGVIPPMAEELKAALKKHDIFLKIVNMTAGSDIDKEVYEWIEFCDTFLVFGSVRYGEDTGNPASTYYESQYASNKKKRIILIRMIPWEETFEQPQARFMFGMNKMVLEWQQGSPMPLDLAEAIAEAVRAENVEEMQTTQNPATDSPTRAAPTAAPGEPEVGTQPEPQAAQSLQSLFGRAPAAVSAFASIRFDGVVPSAAEELQQAMAERGASLEIIDLLGGKEPGPERCVGHKLGGDDIEAKMIGGIEHCDTFVVFGSKSYGEDTGNSASTYYESKFALDRKKRIILIRMIPSDEEYEHLQARMLFGMNKSQDQVPRTASQRTSSHLEIPWELGAPMPADLPDRIVEAMEIGGQSTAL